MQVRRRKSTGSYDGKGVRCIQQDNYFNKKEESDKDSLGDDKESFTDSDEPDSDDYNALDDLNFRLFANISVNKFVETEHNPDITSVNYSSREIWKKESLDESGNDFDKNFHPEQFGLLEDPGVIRFDCIDYPLAVNPIPHGGYFSLHSTGGGQFDPNLFNSC